MQNIHFNIQKEDQNKFCQDLLEQDSQFSTPNLDDEKRYTQNVPLSPFNKFMLRVKKIPNIMGRTSELESISFPKRKINKRKKTKYNTKKKLSSVKFVYLWKNNIFSDNKNPKQILEELKSLLKQSNQC